MRNIPIFFIFLYPTCAPSEILEFQQEVLRLRQNSFEIFQQPPNSISLLNDRNRLLLEGVALGRRPELERPVPRSEFVPTREILKKYTALDIKHGNGVPSAGCSEAARTFAHKSTEARLRFMDGCLTDRIPADKTELKAIIKNLVYLSNSDPNSPDTCTGLLLSKTRVLTAAHCRPRKVYLSDGSTRAVESKEDCAPHISEYCDHAFLKISPASFEPISISLAVPVPGSNLWIPGYAIEDIYKDPDAPDTPKLMWENFGHNSCIVEYARKGCFAHMCQVMGGYSGAPVIDVDRSMSTGEITVVGMHITSDIGDTSCSHDIPVSELHLNFGVPINSVPIVENKYAADVYVRPGGGNAGRLRINPQPIPYNGIRSLDNR